MVRTQDALLVILSSLGLPVAYDHFEVAQSLPYIVYLTTGHSSFAADDITYHETTEFAIELYTEYKDPTLEQLVRDKLTDAGLFYTTSTDEYLPSEQMYMVAFTVTI
jgi:hypothetical protein